MINDGVDSTLGRFFGLRSKPLWERYPGHYRAAVVETNDPLRMHRVRFKCPDLHSWDLKPEDCPWAVPAFDLGAKRQGRWAHPCIGDWVWITFERGHPYGPIWTGFATPTRRKFYAYPSLYGSTPIPVNELGQVQPQPQDYNQAYLPRDERPMSHGWQDRYGNLDLHSAVGFYPVEHQVTPPPPDYDAIQSGQFSSSDKQPAINQPDCKYMLRLSKYGHMLVQADQGYYWRKGKTAGTGEFSGDFAGDEAFEQARWQYLQQLVNEGHPTSAEQFGDQRRLGASTRYGHRLELRDVGWAQPGPIASKSRAGEYADPTYLSTERQNDFRWIKLRTKAGMLLQFYDKGADPEQDNYVKRKLLDEVGHLSEREDLWWAKKDARQMRMVTRYGIKLVLDDRGSHPSRAEVEELPRANGFLVKGRRSGAAAGRQAQGDPRGFNLEFNENDQLNRLLLGTPLGQAAELNDRYEYLLLASTLGRNYATRARGIEENEFNPSPARAHNPETGSHHLLLDHQNEYIRLKTRAGNGLPPDHVANPTGLPPGSLNQGLEIRDGGQGSGPWVELVDADHRGLWFSHLLSLGLWRARQGSQLLQWMDDNQQLLVLYNDAGSQAKIQLYCQGPIEIMGDGKVTVQAATDLELKAGGNIRLQSGGVKFTLLGSSDNIATDAQIIQGGDSITPLNQPQPPPVLEPTDRGTAYNSPFEDCPLEEIEHPI